MVKEVLKNNEMLYVCEACRHVYRERVWAEKCEDFCFKYHACSLSITSHAVLI
ncbi:MAG: hypothetical protein QW789_02380 [Nitrososphaerota archaeon]